MTSETKIIVLVLLVLATRRKYGVDWGLPGSVMESKASYSTMVLGVVDVGQQRCQPDCWTSVHDAE